VPEADIAALAPHSQQPIAAEGAAADELPAPPPAYAPTAEILAP